MNGRKSFSIPLLIVFSMSLLIALQILWLKNSYEKAFYDLRRETNELFRRSVFTLRDSLFAKNIVAVPDTVNTIMSDRITFVRRDSVRRIAESSGDTNVQIYMSGKGDSVSNDVIRPIFSRIQRTQIKGQNLTMKTFVVRMLPDSINTDSLLAHFVLLLNAADIKLQVKIEQHKTEPRMHGGMALAMPPLLQEPREHDRALPASAFNDTLFMDHVRFSAMVKYGASINFVRASLVKEITPQILFSIFLTGMISLAFLALHKNIRAQRHLMELKNDFISNITHELKTPIATVSVALEALKNFQAKNNPKMAGEYLDIAQMELDRLTHMADRILATSVLESEESEFTFEVFPLDTIVTEIETSIRPLLEKRNASMEVVKDDQQYDMCGSKIHITYAIHNLLDNALKYSRDNPRITVSLMRKSGNIIISVQDRGIGIDPEYHHKVFEKFFRVPTGDIHNTKGYGLGLSYVSSVVHHHGGHVDVTSSPGAGSTFTITIPVVQTQKKALRKP